jgi:hypothetical protein
MQVKTEFIESESVGYRQIRLTFDNGKQATYFQEYKASGPWHRLEGGQKASIQLEAFIDSRVAFHRNRTKERLAELERAMNG